MAATSFQPKKLADGCSCGACDARGFDDYGNIDFGQRWSDEREDYVTRNCPVARSRTNLQGGDLYLVEQDAKRYSRRGVR